jgi:hypothetical protein
MPGHAGYVDRHLACGDNIHGSISVVRATGLVTIGDLDGSLSCAGNTIAGTVWLQHNTDGVQVSDNIVYGGSMSLAPLEPFRRPTREPLICRAT